MTFASTAGRATWLQSIASIQIGLAITFSIEITALTNTNIRVSDLFQAGTGFTSQIYNYTDSSGNTTAGIGAFTTLPGIGLYTVNAITTATTGNIIFGTDCNGVARTGNVTITKPQFQYGTRVSSRVYFANSSTAAAYHAPRFDYSPTNIGEPMGLLIEGQTQNVLFYSQDVTQTSRWTIQGGIPSSYTSISATGGTAPDNTNTANLCTESTANNSRSIYQGLTAAAGTYTASVWVKAGTGSARYIRLVLPSAAGNFVYVTVNISTGAVTQAAAAVGTATNASAVITSYAGSWYRIQLTGTLAAAVSFVFIVPLDSATPPVSTTDYGREAYLGNGSSFYVWGAQLELGSGASSYIPTGASGVTRNADSCLMNDISSLSYSTTNGSMVYEGRFSKINSASYPTRMGFLTNAGGDPAFEIFTNGTNIFSGIRSTAANNEITRTIAIDTNYKFATAFNASAASQVRCSLNGAAAVGSGTSALTNTRVPTVFGFARSGYELYFPCGSIKTAKYWNTTLSDADLVSKST
ncbi:MAG: hypothetical protein EBY29_00030 [Planctomycetes bacterium]|nr:hypothetical protein [Planctomycetota bacterium]